MKPTNPRSLILNFAALVMVLIVFCAYGYQQGFLFGGRLVKDSGKNISDYSAVFLTNGQVYFGKIYTSNTRIVDLRDIYYLQVGQNLQNATTKDEKTAKPDVNLIK